MPLLGGLTSVSMWDKNGFLTLYLHSQSWHLLGAKLPDQMEVDDDDNFNKDIVL